jgi:hypothetical protein
MIPASRLALTTALFWFVAANLAGLLLGLGALPYTWRPAHAHMQLLGFVSLMIYGVAYHARSCQDVCVSVCVRGAYRS